MLVEKYVNEIAPDVAAKLASDLHSSAEENIISSMLAACLNESDEFMKWFCYKRTKLLHGNTKFDKLWATANDRIPYIVTDQVKPACTYRRPDIIIWHRADEESWIAADKGDNDEKTKAIMREVRAIFIEVKKLHISDDEKFKYERFIQCISRVWRGNPKSVSFVIVSSHDNLTAKKIRNGDLRHRSTYRAEESRWVELLRYSSGGIKPVHITLTEIFVELRQNRKYKEYHLIQLFKSYLALYTAQVDDKSYRKSWVYLIRLYEDNYAGLRKEIIESVRGLAGMAGIRLERKRYLKERMKVANLVTIEDQMGGKYQLRLLQKSRDEIPENELHVKIRRSRIKFCLSDGSADNIADRMREIRDKMGELQQRK